MIPISAAFRCALAVHPDPSSWSASLAEARWRIEDHAPLRRRLERVAAFSLAHRAGYFELASRELSGLEAFVVEQVLEHGMSTAYLRADDLAVLSEPVALFARHVPRVTVLTDGMHPLPRRGLEQVAVQVALQEVQLSDSFPAALAPWNDDPRVIVMLPIAASTLVALESMLLRVAANGNRVRFSMPACTRHDRQLARRAIDEALRLRHSYPAVVLDHPRVISALAALRLQPAHCRFPLGNDLLAELDSFLREEEGVAAWVDFAEAHWSQFIWSPWHPEARRRAARADA